MITGFSVLFFTHVFLLSRKGNSLGKRDSSNLLSNIYIIFIFLYLSSIKFGISRILEIGKMGILWVFFRFFRKLLRRQKSSISIIQLSLFVTDLL